MAGVIIHSNFTHQFAPLDLNPHCNTLPSPNPLLVYKITRYKYQLEPKYLEILLGSIISSNYPFQIWKTCRETYVKEANTQTLKSMSAKVLISQLCGYRTEHCAVGTQKIQHPPPYRKYEKNRRDCSLVLTEMKLEGVAEVISTLTAT